MPTLFRNRYQIEWMSIVIAVPEHVAVVSVRIPQVAQLFQREVGHHETYAVQLAVDIRIWSGGFIQVPRCIEQHPRYILHQFAGFVSGRDVWCRF